MMVDTDSASSEERVEEWIDKSTRESSFCCGNGLIANGLRAPIQQARCTMCPKLGSCCDGNEQRQPVVGVKRLASRGDNSWFAFPKQCGAKNKPVVLLTSSIRSATVENR